MNHYASQESSILDGDLVIGEFIVRPLLKTIRPASSPKGSNEQTLPDKAVAVLIYLAQNARKVCERDDILDAVWGEDRDAYDRVLDNAVAEIRRVLEDDARNPKYIQTVPRRGYRLLVPAYARQPHLMAPAIPDRRPAPSDLAPVGESAASIEISPTNDSRPSIEPPPEAATTPPIEPPRPSRATLLGLSVGALLAAATLAVVAWFWPSERAVRVDVQPADAQSEAEVELASNVRQSLLAAHPCGEGSLLQPAAALSSADVTLTASVERIEGRTMLRVSHSDPSFPAVLAQSVGRGVATDADLGSFLTDVGAMIDRQVCFEEGLPELRQACHCRAATTRTFHKMAEPEPHIELLQQAIELDPGDVDSYEALAMIFRSIGHKDRAGDTLSAGLAQIDDPTSVSALVLRRRLAETLGDFPTEASLIERLRDLRPGEPRWILAEAAYSARHRRDCAKAIMLIGGLGGNQIPPEATRLEDSESVWTCLLHSDHQEEAARRLAQAPQDAGTRFQLALGFILAGRLDEARTLANEYLALQPDSADAYWLLASVEGRQGAYSAARHWLRQMKERIEWPNQDHRYRTTAGWTDLRDGHARECVERFADMPEGSRPWSVMARWTLGRCQVQAGDLAEARQTLRDIREELSAAQTLWQQEFVFHLEASLMAAETDDPEKLLRAAERMIRAVELGPTDYPYFVTEAGLLLERAGDFERAREFYERAVAYSPSYPWGNCRLGLLYRRLDRDDDAATHMRRALDVFGDPPEGPLGKQCAAALAELGA